ncbi:hypothetical protein C7N43_00660 [Sphingobacteriales bacterium UPWRP_1]|nr:hypothetical protein B6N25_10395 [Sphingobacteriales bacterium TSM_CSS]PSJ78985.1 hypothetical protein C7N43_00660 [Sphingobacteriales bacterium UPWRP_1]
MKQYLSDTLLFLLPVLLYAVVGIALFLSLDPFRVVHQYQNYSYPVATLNREFISTETFLKNYNKYHYNSFIFGSSRSNAFKPSEWKNYLQPNDSPFSFDASGETVFGIRNKLTFLHKKGAAISNALVILCHNVAFDERNTKTDSHIYISHPAISGGSYIDYYLVFVKDFFNPKFLYHYLRYFFTRQFSPGTSLYIMFSRISFNPITNEVLYDDLDHELSITPRHYYKNKAAVFYPSPGQRTDTANLIQPRHVQMLHDIKNIFERHHTDYKIIISPLYDQVKFSTADQQILHILFGNRLYDFSGENEFTCQIQNYYEESHYRPHVANAILDSIYHCQTTFPPK